MKRTIICALLALAATGMEAQVEQTLFLGERHCMVRPDMHKRYLLIPVEEKSEISNVKLMAQSKTVKTLNVRLAVDNVDYYVPLDLSVCDGKPALLDIHVNGEERKDGVVRDYVCWKSFGASDTIDTKNREQWRPVYHHTPTWGWMNDPNGLFYKDGLWHLYYQWNPYGSQWENMHWGHSVSRDLMHWQDMGCGMEPDALGNVFSGCCVVDHDNTAGFGADAIVAMYTSAAESQTQSLAYSTDGGRSFTKYDKNPVVVADVPDFRDPHIFWNSEIKAWNLVLAAGQEMRIYSSKNLKDWHYESSFGRDYGSHDGVWECPDLFPLTVEDTGKTKWVMLCNINPGGPSGGSATQYFVGSFDGHAFKCDTAPETTLWLDYGKDNYATVSFDNAPDSRRVIIGWMSNWQYANQVPTRQYRSANTIAREPYLYREGDMTLCGTRPATEMQSAKGKTAIRTTFKAGHKRIKNMFKTAQGAYAMTMKLNAAKGERLTLTLANGKGEQVAMTYDEAAGTFAVDRDKSGQTAFSTDFPIVATAPVHGGRLNELQIFVDRSSIEVFLNDGKTAMSTIVFPSEPYNTLSVQGVKGSKIQSLEIYNLKNKPI